MQKLEYLNLVSKKFVWLCRFILGVIIYKHNLFRPLPTCQLKGRASMVGSFVQNPWWIV